MDNIKVAFLYDFDKTLCPKYMQDYGMFEYLDISPSEYWQGANKYALSIGMDQILSSMYWLSKISKDKNKPINKAKMAEFGKNIKFFNGVTTWFGRINEYGKSLNLDIEHYIISSGHKEILEGMPIAKEFSKIFACEYAFDEEGNILWPKQVINYTGKTQYLYRVKKYAFENFFDGQEVNEHTTEDQVAIPFDRMIYFGDGDTDIPSMRVLIKNNGTAICVYDKDIPDCYIKSKTLLEDGRVNFIAPANYEDNSDIDKYVKQVLNRIKADYQVQLQEDKLK